MTFVTYKNRSSSDYRFSTTDLNDPAITELKEMLKRRNTEIKSFRRRFPDYPWAQEQRTQGLRIRARGPRRFVYAHDTPMENATHYDIYVRDYARY